MSVCVCLHVCEDIGNYCLTVSANTGPIFSSLLLQQLQQSHMFNKSKYSYLFITSLQRDEIHNEHGIPACTVSGGTSSLNSLRHGNTGDN